LERGICGARTGENEGSGKEDIVAGVEHDLWGEEGKEGKSGINRRRNRDSVRKEGKEEVADVEKE